MVDGYRLMYVGAKVSKEMVAKRVREKMLEHPDMKVLEIFIVNSGLSPKAMAKIKNLEKELPCQIFFTDV